jgi:amidase
LADILSLDAKGQLQALAARRISARELLEASVARTDRLNPKLNAVVSRDLDRAYESARIIDDRRARGESLGLLAGLPMTVKDTLDAEGLPASAGTESLLNRSVEDAEVVARVRAEGAIIWGKTNTPVSGGDWQTYNTLYGTTNNPWDLERTPGGSSGGSAAALAARLTALEIGADLAGSLRVPASFCGVFAHKPTYGIVSQRGMVPPPGIHAERDLAVVGPMARSARDLRLLLSIIAEAPIPADAPPAELKGLKVALWLGETAFVVDTEVKTVITAFADRLAAAGAIVEPVQSPVDTEALMFAYTMLFFSMTGAGLPSGVRRLYELLRGPAKIMRSLGAKPLSWAQSVLANTARHREWLKANDARAQMGDRMRRFFARHDVLLAPVSPVPAFPHDHRPMRLRTLRCSDGREIAYWEILDWAALATVCGLPATAVPAGLTGQGLPVGVQIIGPHRGDSHTLAVAQAIDEAIGGFRAPPLE